MLCQQQNNVHTQERRDFHDLGLSRDVAPDAFVAVEQTLLDPDPGSADLGFGTPIQGWADAFLQA